MVTSSQTRLMTQHSTPSLPTRQGMAEWVLKVLQPCVSFPRGPQASLGDSYSRNMCLRSWCEGKLGPKDRSKPLVPCPQSWVSAVKTTLTLPNFFHFKEELSHALSSSRRMTVFAWHRKADFWSPALICNCVPDKTASHISAFLVCCYY